MQRTLKDSVMIVDNLPPKTLRRGRAEWLNDEKYIKSAVEEVDRLKNHAGITTSSNVLDVGCSTGKLLIGIKNSISSVNHYHGVDVDKKHIEWADKALSTDNYKFSYLNLQNDRYNNGGKPIDDSFRFPTDRKFNIIYLYSVFSHMVTHDVIIYLREFRRILDINGTVVMTVFIDNNIKDEEIIGTSFVKFNQQFFESLLSDFSIIRFEDKIVESYQSIYYLQ